ncbi:MAG TPA: isocitrate lyase/phosphoenolpyruvate mutase family protein [Pseudohaliea sp.]|nr:isocitrate lyase/phosphoenolpyruvate mutase family protein [Pseudohaliea sp.]
MVSQAQKANAFRQLHDAPDAFVIPNPWDIGSAKMLAALGYRALATTSAGMAWSAGLLDGEVAREHLLEHCRMLSAATGLPLAADLEDCFASSPEGVAETIQLGAEAGLVGGSVEDWEPGRHADEPRIRDLGEAKERVAAAVEAARSLPFPFTLTARAENHIRGVTDLADTIRRLQAYQEAGADVLYAPGLRTLDDIRAVVQAVDRPVNVLMGGATELHTVAQLQDIGVKRISLGGAFAAAAYGGMITAAQEVLEQGTFTFRNHPVSGRDIATLLKR